jgi:L-malate glycosyltransferase
MSRRTKPIHVMHIASGDRWAGAEVQLWTLLRQLNKLDDIRGRAVLMNEGDTADRLRESGIPVDVLDESRLSGLQIFAGMRRLIRLHQPDVIHTHRQKENILGTLANAATLRRPSVRTTHGAPELNHPRSKPHKRLIAWMDWACGRYLQDRIISVSQDLGHQLQKAFPNQKISVIENGLDIHTFLDQAKHMPDFRRDHPAQKHIGIVGRLESVKRIDIFLKMVKRLQEQNLPRPLTFHVFGDGGMRTELEDISTHLGIAHAVRFHGHRNDIAACINALDVLVMCSDHEGLPMTILEAMGSGTPIVAHKVGGIADALCAGECGILLTTQEPSQYAEAVLQLINDPTLHNKIAKKAKQVVSERYSAETNALKVRNLYATLIANRCFRAN